MAGEVLNKETLELLDAHKLRDFPDIPVMVHRKDLSEPVAPKARIVFPSVRADQVEGFWYVSDIHLEFFFDRVCGGMPVGPGLAVDIISLVLEEMLADVEEARRRQPLLIAGDTSHARPFFRIFLHELSKLWKGPVVAVLGNHELWNGHPEDWGPRHLRNIWRAASGLEDGYAAPPAAHMFTRYKWDAKEEGAYLLEGDLLSVRDGIWTFHSRRELEDLSDEGLAGLLGLSSLAILGGTGFAGLNDDANFHLGIYRSALSGRSEEASLSRWFARLHDRIAGLSAKDNVVVLTHMACPDWTENPFHSGWVYVSGHTHENGRAERGGALDLHDNQIGYENTRPKLRWHSLALD